jgi:hypothetical protein
MEHRLVLSPILPTLPAGAPAAVVMSLPPETGAPAMSALLSYYPPDPCTSRSAHSLWADGPVNDEGLVIHPDPQPPQWGPLHVSRVVATYFAPGLV